MYTIIRVHQQIKIVTSANGWVAVKRQAVSGTFDECIFNAGGVKNFVDVVERMLLSEKKGFCRQAAVVKFRALCSQVPLRPKSVIDDKRGEFRSVGIELTKKRFFRNVPKSSEQCGLILIEP